MTVLSCVSELKEVFIKLSGICCLCKKKNLLFVTDWWRYRKIHCVTVCCLTWWCCYGYWMLCDMYLMKCNWSFFCLIKLQFTKDTSIVSWGHVSWYRYKIMHPCCFSMCWVWNWILKHYFLIVCARQFSIFHYISLSYHAIQMHIQWQLYVLWLL